MKKLHQTFVKKVHQTESWNVLHQITPNVYFKKVTPYSEKITRKSKSFTLNNKTFTPDLFFFFHQIRKILHET